MGHCRHHANACLALGMVKGWDDCMEDWIIANDSVDPISVVRKAWVHLTEEIKVKFTMD